ncbi:spore coat protein GerQ [Peribacillus frigoritolerans]|uniref:Spore coat protein GerQ n=1 Tax=Peribacillus castrilensis TaxID=2897690 RepID=A0AAW9N8S4_9BACI|nr:spore coat protein GerQ [Peribacillus castrilensis]MEC0297118.1 spore coat protein GerQ [Peribacillus castrilensis]MEC0346992.1 spore coat protein GerQ [Peribacillus castrilensis]
MSQNNPYGNYPYGGSPYYPYENNEPELRQQNPNPQQGYQQQGYPQQGFQQPSYQPQQPTMAGTPQQMPVTMGQPPSGPQIPGMLPVEASYIENILRLNKGKLATVYTTFENNQEWNAMIFKGIIEAAGRDHLIISDPQTGKRYLIPMVYLDYITFDEEIEYDYPFGGAGLATYSPR